ncbi:hypothetical protein D515_04942 [Grimontia indica]|uniref:Uncharacterized protein n=1 Tax=Grimontia indica TaxID=1056512 RepID=R1GXR0_9GAMM|nr:hypothetical protein D515_04942 [Grimontia indica]
MFKIVLAKGVEDQHVVFRVDVLFNQHSEPLKHQLVNV